MRYRIKTKITLALLLTILLGTVGIAQQNSSEDAKATAKMESGQMVEQALFAGGCFWCMEKPFEALDGVLAVESGYAGGTTANPTYQNYGQGDHIEVVQVSYDPSKVSYGQLLNVFWRQIDPTDAGGQFVDRGHEYSSAIFVKNEEQRGQAESSRAQLEAAKILDKPVVTPILDDQKFWPAEGYHQDYYQKNPIRYKFYRSRSGRDDFLNRTWKDVELDLSGSREQMSGPTETELRKRLTPLQYRVTRQDATEPPFRNEYWDNTREGIYVDIVSGEPLFSSRDKYKSGTGWPSFTRPLVADNIVEHEDRKLFTTRTEVRSKNADSHLGHVFSDGPAPTGLRYCINSASLRFIAVEELESEGYGTYSSLFM